MAKGYIFDLDGTIYLGQHVISGAPEAIRTLRERGDRIVFLSNKPIAARASYKQKLRQMGIEAGLDEIINSNYVLALYLAERIQRAEQVLVIGEQPVLDELQRRNIPVTEKPEEAQYVVLSWDRSFTYAKLNAAFQAWQKGAILLATNPDRTCPVEGGQLPDCGAIIGALEGATGQPIDKVVGKPSPLMAEAALKQIGLEAGRCYMIGDRLETDVKMGNAAGMSSVLVLTGVTTQEMLRDTPFQPKHVVQSIAEVPALP